MILPLDNDLCISIVNVSDGVSMHLARTYNNNLEYLPSVYYDKYRATAGISLVHTKQDEFPFDNPFRTSDIKKTLDFIWAAQIWANHKITEKAQTKG